MFTTNLDLKGNVPPHGLTREEAVTRLRQYGPNAVPEAKPHLFLAIAKKFWAPVPWMLEVTIWDVILLTMIQLGVTRWGALCASLDRSDPALFRQNDQDSNLAARCCRKC